MALRTPLILNQSTARIEELAIGDSFLGSAIDALLGRNRLINGSMRWWRRGTSFSASGYSVERWYFNAGGVNTPSLSRSTLSPVNFDSECIYFARIAYGAITDAASHFVVFEQRIENVTTLAGRTVTVSFKVYNSGAAGRQIAVELGQHFGAGGSAQISGIGATKYSLAAGINTITHTVQLPSIAGKTIGANSNVILTLWATGGSNFNSRNASLGAQSGDVHFTEVQMEQGSASLLFDCRPDGDELILCQRYFRSSFAISETPANSSNTSLHRPAAAYNGQRMRTYVNFDAPMRAAPSILFYSASEGGSLTPAGTWRYFDAASGVWRASSTTELVASFDTGIIVDLTASGFTAAGCYLTAGQYTADAEL